MPQTTIVFYREHPNSIPVLDWLAELHARDRRAYLKCVELIDRLSQFGFELRRPTADILHEGVYELRGKAGRVNYRLLYFFHGQNIAILAHAITKEREIPAKDIELALSRKAHFELSPEKHTHKE